MSGPEFLTARQVQIPQAIRDMADLHGYPPTLREIGQAVGLCNASSVAHHLTALEQRGVLAREPGCHRSYQGRLS